MLAAALVAVLAAPVVAAPSEGTMPTMEGLAGGTLSSHGDTICGLQVDGTVQCWGASLGPPPFAVWIQVEAGSLHACGVGPGGGEECWGTDENGDTATQSGSFAKVSAGGPDSCGLLTDGSALCWGTNDGTNNNLVTNTPAASTKFRDLSLGDTHACGIKANGDLACWGDNTGGAATPPAGKYVQVSSGRNFSCAVKDDGSLACWGSDTSSKVSGKPTLGSFIQVSAGLDHACAVRSDGPIDCWGSSTNGQASSQPGSYVQVVAGGHHSCAVRADGTTGCWGSISVGQTIPNGGPFFAHGLTVGPNNTCGIRTDGTAVCWGDSALAAPAGTTYRQLSLGSNHACGVKSQDGSVDCFGQNTFGQATDQAGPFRSVSGAPLLSCGVKAVGTLQCWGDTTNSVPTTTPAGNWIDTAAGANFACAVKSDGTLQCWGANDASNGFIVTNTPSGTFKQVVAGLSFACALATDGSISCWGLDNFNQVTGKPSGSGHVALAAGDSSACAVSSAAFYALVCWGNNANGAATPPGGNYTQLGLGDFNGCAMDAGLLTCWGDNNSGEQGQAPASTSAPPPAGTVGVPYSHTLTATGTPPVRWGLREGEGSLPPGLTLNASTGVISGTPTASGDFVSRVVASNEFFADVSEIVGISVAPHAGPPGPPPPPVAGQSVDARVVSGTVTAQCPGQPAGPLTGAQQLKVGCTIDSTNGRVAITSASDRQGHTQTADFYEGAFTVSQTTGLVPAKLTAAKKKKKKPKTVKALITVLTLKGPEPSGCGKKGKLVAASKRGRRLWGSGKGRFRTVGHRAHAIVRGTVWLTEERCNGTYVQVNQGVVSVQDLTLKKTVTVKAPHHYLAPAKKPKKKK